MVVDPQFDGGRQVRIPAVQVLARAARCVEANGTPGRAATPGASPCAPRGRGPRRQGIEQAATQPAFAPAAPIAIPISATPWGAHCVWADATTSPPRVTAIRKRCEAGSASDSAYMTARRLVEPGLRPHPARLGRDRRDHRDRGTDVRRPSWVGGGPPRRRFQPPCGRRSVTVNGVVSDTARRGCRGGAGSSRRGRTTTLLIPLSRGVSTLARITAWLRGRALANRGVNGRRGAGGARPAAGGERAAQAGEPWHHQGERERGRFRLRARRFPVTLYKEQWAKLLNMADDIRAFIRDHDGELKAKD